MESEKKFYKFLGEYEYEGITVKEYEWPQDREIVLEDADSKARFTVPSFDPEHFGESSFTKENYFENVIERLGDVRAIGHFKIVGTDRIGVFGKSNDFNVVENFHGIEPMWITLGISYEDWSLCENIYGLMIEDEE